MTSTATRSGLTPEERDELEKLAQEAAKATENTTTIRQRQTQRWRELLAAGRTKTDIADASGVTINAVNSRLAPAPSRVNRGKRAQR